MTSLLLALCLVAPGQTHTFPLEKGTTWMYKGTVGWTIAGAATKSKPIEWKVEVVEHAMRPDREAALLRGWPSDLAWYEEGTTSRGDYLIVRDHESYFLFGDKAKEEFRRFQSDRNYKPSADRLFFRDPLKVNARFCGPDDEQRTDASYCWFIQGRAKHRVAASGVPGGLIEIYTLVFRTNPDHEVVDIHPGVGITHYEYHHHGTVSDVDLDLISYAAGEK